MAIDYTKLMNPQWARWFDQIAETQGMDPSQPYNINLGGQFGKQVGEQKASLRGLQELTARQPQPTRGSLDTFDTDDLLTASRANRARSRDLFKVR